MRRLVLPLMCLLAMPLWADSFADALSELEIQHGGRLGVAAFNSADGNRLAYRADTRFAMCSTFKAVLAGAILQKVDSGQLKQQSPVRYDASELLDYAPVTRLHLADGQMTVAALAKAAVTLSDNTAANLLLKVIGGPQALTAFYRQLGDSTSRLDRFEPSLNSNEPGDVRDTSTAAATLHSWRQLLLGKALLPASRQQLLRWLKDSQTGQDRIRAGLPQGWQVGDKTGSCENGGTNDIAIVWPANTPPYLLAIYYSDGLGSSAQKNRVLAEVSRLVAKRFTPRP